MHLSAIEINVKQKEWFNKRNKLILYTSEEKSQFEILKSQQ